MRVLIGLLLVSWAASASAQAYPDHPVRIVVPFAPGGSTDVTARIIAEGLSATFKQQFVVENKPGAAGTLGVDTVAKSPPDGYTLGLSGVGPTAIIPLLDPTLKYSPSRDFDTVAGLSAVDLVLVARPGFGPKTLLEMLEYAKANPEKVIYGSAGVAGPVHLQLENLAYLAKAKMLHVPYAGDAQVVTALLSGQVDIAYLTLAGGLGFLNAGKVRALAAGGPKRSQSLPDLATVEEQTGFKGYDAYTWNILVTARGTPPDILAKLNRAINDVFARSDIRDKMDKLGLLTMSGDVPTAAKFVDGEIEKYKRIIAATGVKRE